MSSGLESQPAESWSEYAERTLRSHGHRASAPRTAVISLIGGQDCVLSAEEIARRLGRRKRPVGIATVYRTLETLERLRLVQRLDAGGGSAQYEPAFPGGEPHHHHLICDACGKVTPFEDAGVERALATAVNRLDYPVTGHEVILRGSCPDCALAGD